MASTYTLISSNVLSSSAASVTFSSIPSTYTDLVLKVSARGTGNGNNIGLRFNGVSTGQYSRIYLMGDGATASSSIGSSETSADMRAGYNPASATASTFSNAEIYIPSYQASQNKPLGSFNANENNGTTAQIAANANLWSNTASITSLEILIGTGSFVSGSSFYLYGIKNS